MDYLKVISDTVAKSSPTTKLLSERIPVSKGTIVSGYTCELVFNHYLVDGKFYYYEHVELLPKILCTKITRTVNGVYQRDNKLVPSAACAHTSMVAAVRVLKGISAFTNGQKQQEDWFYEQMLANNVPRGHHDKIAALTTKLYGLKVEVDYKCPHEKLKRHLSENNLATYSGKFTSSGHIILITGYDETGYTVCDPWGEYPYSTPAQRKEGNNQHYSYNLIDKIAYHGKAGGRVNLVYR
jgi:hypothetical protein